MWKIQARSKRAHPQHLKVPPKFWICRSFSSSPRKNKKEKKRAFFFCVLAIWWIGPAYPTCDGSNAQRTYVFVHIHDCESFSRVYICPVSGFSSRRYIIFWWREANRPTLVNECAVLCVHTDIRTFLFRIEREGGGELVKTKKEKKNWRCDERIGKNQEMRTFFFVFFDSVIRVWWITWHSTVMPAVERDEPDLTQHSPNVRWDFYLLLGGNFDDVTEYNIYATKKSFYFIG